MGLSRMAEKCVQCPYKEKCDKKRMEALAMASMPAAGHASQPALIRHDYRDIKIAPNTTVTIDLEEMKRQAKKDFYKNMGIGLDYGA